MGETQWWISATDSATDSPFCKKLKKYLQISSWYVSDGNKSNVIQTTDFDFATITVDIGRVLVCFIHHFDSLMYSDVNLVVHLYT